MRDSPLNDTSFRTKIPGVYAFDARINNIKSNPVEVLAINPVEKIDKIDITVNKKQFLANGLDTVFVGLKIFDKEGKEINEINPNVYVNDSVSTHNYLNVIKPGEYRILARINSITSNTIVVKAIDPISLVQKIELSSNTSLIVANLHSHADLTVQFWDIYEQPVQVVNYNMWANGKKIFENKFSTSISGKYELEVLSGQLKSNPIIIHARKDIYYEEVSLPIIFHVVHFGDDIGHGFNREYSRFERALVELNKSYSNKKGSSNPNAVDTRIRFRCAKLSPRNLELDEPGVNRIDGTSFDNGADGADSSDKAKDQLFGSLERIRLMKNTFWDPTEYLNVWIMPVTPEHSAAQYSPILQKDALPGLPSKLNTENVEDSLVQLYIYPTHIFGSLDHEIGHHLGLLHTFSTNSCLSSDYCPDTYSLDRINPVTICSDNRGTLVRDNQMDYDGIKNAFTYDQRERMMHMIEHGIFLKKLKYSSK